MSCERNHVAHTTAVVLKPCFSWHAACRALHLELPYTEAIRAVLLLGGDTDTNAAIVGGLVGALWGAAAIPASMKQPVLSFGRGSGGQPRPSFLHAEQQPRLFEQLWRDTTASG